MNHNPNINTRETNALQGFTRQSKIDFYGLGEVTRKFRHAGLSLAEITNELNTKYVGEEAPKISIMGVSRWCRDNIDDEIDLRYSEVKAPNPYNELCEALEITNRALELQKVCMDTCEKSLKTDADVFKNIKSVKEISSELDKFISRKQQLAMAVLTTMEKVYSYQNMSNVLVAMLEFIKGHDKVLYAELLDMLRSNPSYIEIIRKIQPEGKGK